MIHLNAILDCNMFFKGKKVTNCRNTMGISVTSKKKADIRQMNYFLQMSENMFLKILKI